MWDMMWLAANSRPAAWQAAEGGQREREWAMRPGPAESWAEITVSEPGLPSILGEISHRHQTLDTGYNYVYLG